MNCLCDIRVFIVPNYVWPLNYSVALRPNLHEGMRLIAQDWMFCPTIGFNIQNHKICYFYELNPSYVNIFGSSISLKSYLISSLLSSSFLSHYLWKSFNFYFLFFALTLFDTFFFCSFFWNIFISIHTFYFHFFSIFIFPFLLIHFFHIHFFSNFNFFSNVFFSFLKYPNLRPWKKERKTSLWPLFFFHSHQTCDCLSILALQQLVLSEQNAALMMMFFFIMERGNPKNKMVWEQWEAWRNHGATPFRLFSKIMFRWN